MTKIPRHEKGTIRPTQGKSHVEVVSGQQLPTNNPILGLIIHHG